MRFLACLVVVVSMLMVASASAQTRVETRGGVHDGYGRLVFSWPQPVVFEARIEGNELVVEFTQPLSSDLAPAIRLLRQYMSDGRIAGR